MRRQRWISAAAVTVAAMAGAAGSAQAAPVTLCMKAGQPVVAPTSGGTCASGYTARKTASEADLQAANARIAKLEDKLKHVTRVNTTLRITGANLQLVNGSGATNTKNGLGNVIVGYNEQPGTQSGSHNILVGPQHTATSFGGLAVGSGNTISGYSSTALGYLTSASGPYSLTAGSRNTASGYAAAATGGTLNTASGFGAAVTGGLRNRAISRWSVITAGCENLAAAAAESHLSYACEIVNDDPNNSYDSGEFASLHGGSYNQALGVAAVVTGGARNSASGNAASVAGGSFNAAIGTRSAVSGGRDNRAAGLWASVTGGWGNNASYDAASVTGGYKNHAAGKGSAILGGYGENQSPLTTTWGTYPAGP